MARGRKRQLVWSPPADGIHCLHIVPERSTHLGSFPFNKVETPESVKEAPIYQMLIKLCASVMLGRVRGAIASCVLFEISLTEKDVEVRQDMLVAADRASNDWVGLLSAHADRLKGEIATPAVIERTRERNRERYEYALACKQTELAEELKRLVF